MKWLIVLALLMVAGCAQRVIVEDCYKIEGSEYSHCKFVKRL